MMSAVRKPFSNTLCTAPSTRSAAAGSFKLKRSIIAAERIVANGLAMLRPAMSGAVPCTGS